MLLPRSVEVIAFTYDDASAGATVIHRYYTVSYLVGSIMLGAERSGPLGPLAEVYLELMYVTCSRYLLPLNLPVFLLSLNLFSLPLSLLPLPFTFT